MSHLPGVGLERDLRQNENNFPIVHDNGDQSKYFNGEQPQNSGGKYMYLAAQTNPEMQICGVRRTTFWLTVALVVVLSLGIVGSGVAGSLAVKRGRNANQKCLAQPDSSGTPTNPLPSSTPTTPAVNCTHIPTTECESLPLPPKAYVSTISRHQFSISCTTDYPGGDMIGIKVYSFVDCIEACSSYNTHVDDPRLNSTCLGVSYDPAFGLAGAVLNCFLKSSLGDGPYGKNTTSSAVVIKA